MSFAGTILPHRKIAGSFGVSHDFPTQLFVVCIQFSVEKLNGPHFFDPKFPRLLFDGTVCYMSPLVRGITGGIRNCSEDCVALRDDVGVGSSLVMTVVQALGVG